MKRQYVKSYENDENAIKLIEKIKDAYDTYTCYKDIINEILDQSLSPLANKNARLDFYSDRAEKSYKEFKHLQDEFANKYVSEFNTHNANWSLDYYTYIVNVTVNCTCKIEAPTWREAKER